MDKGAAMKQIAQMRAFILQEAKEKAEEINENTESQCMHRKLTLQTKASLETRYSVQVYSNGGGMGGLGGGGGARISPSLWCERGRRGGMLAACWAFVLWCGNRVVCACVCVCVFEGDE